MLDPGSGRGDESMERKIPLEAALGEVERRRMKNCRSGKPRMASPLEKNTAADWQVQLYQQQCDAYRHPSCVPGANPFCAG